MVPGRGKILKVFYVVVKKGTALQINVVFSALDEENSRKKNSREDNDAL